MKKSTQSITEVSQKLFQLMENLGYSKSTISIYRNVYSEFFVFSCSDEKEPLFSEQITIDYVNHYSQTHNVKTNKGKKRLNEVQRLMDMLMDCYVHGAVLRHKVRGRTMPEPFRSDLSVFSSYLLDSGLSKGTADRNCAVLGQLADFLIQHGRNDFGSMTMEELLDFASTQMGYTKKTAAASMYALRVFIDYLNKTGKNNSLKKEELPKVHFVSRRHLPKIWSEEECKRVLDAVDRNSPVGKRDFAILSLAVNYGMRTSDILTLEFSNFDWNSRKISFSQKKTKSLNTIIFDEQTGWVIIDYLQNGRPSVENCNLIFLQAKPPYPPMNNFNVCLQKYAERAGIHYERNQMHSMHSLRHSLATRMLSLDIPVNTIADTLGHTSIHSSGDYLQIDIEHLRQCALEMEVDL